MRYLLYLFVVFLITGCSYSSLQINRSLDEVGVMIQSDPVAAMERLNKFDVAEFKDSATVAHWALLYSEAMVANQLTAPTDTIVNIAITYYGYHNKKQEYQYASQLKALLQGDGEKDALATALYLQKEKEFFVYRERTKREQLVFLSLIGLLIAFGIIIWQKQRIKIKDIRNETLIAEASMLMQGLLCNESRCSVLQIKLQDMFSNRFEVINQLCETYYETQGMKTERKAIAEKVKSQIEEIKSDTGLFLEMEKCVNDFHDGLLESLKKEFPSMNPEEYRLFIYLACNLSNRSIAALLEENIDVIYKRKSRLKSKLLSLDNSTAQQFKVIF